MHIGLVASYCVNINVEGSELRGGGWRREMEGRWGREIEERGGVEGVGGCE